MTLDELVLTLKDALIYANEDCEESWSIDKNSYGAGYDCGYRDALNRVLNTINGKENENRL